VEGLGLQSGGRSRSGRGPVHAAGFSIFEQGNESVGMAGASKPPRLTPLATVFNAVGLAFVTQTDGSIGFTPTSRASRPILATAPIPFRAAAHGERRIFGVPAAPPTTCSRSPAPGRWASALRRPFAGLTTEWENPNSFAGAFLSTNAALPPSTSIRRSWQVTPNYFVGISASGGRIALSSDVELSATSPVNNPFTQ